MRPCVTQSSEWPRSGRNDTSTLALVSVSFEFRFCACVLCWVATLKHVTDELLIALSTDFWGWSSPRGRESNMGSKDGDASADVAVPAMVGFVGAGVAALGFGAGYGARSYRSSLAYKELVVREPV